jgi:FkbM family methyltransferase
MALLVKVRAKIDNIRIIIKHTKSPIACILAYVLRRKQKIEFRWKFVGDFDWNQIWFILQLADAGWFLYNRDNDLFTFTDGKLKFVAPSYDSVSTLIEKPSPYRCFDYKGAVVLDIGAFTGDSIILFLKWGAKKVIAYEPVPENVKLIKSNIEINKLEGKVTVIPYAVASRKGCIEFSYDYFNKGFGSKPGRNRISLPCISFEDVLAGTHDVSIAKVDCEGCERHLLEISEIRIPRWIIEVHDIQLLPLLVKHFEGKGFDVHVEHQGICSMLRATLRGEHA